MVSLVEFLPSQFIAGGIPIDKFVRVQVVFRQVGMVPSHQEIFVKRDIKTPRILIVLKHEFWHHLHIQTGMIMLNPEIVTQDR